MKFRFRRNFSLVTKAIPSFLTLANLVLGLVSMAIAYHGNMAGAAILVVIGMGLDALDGRAARYFHAESEFGKQLDSLSDVVTFGVTPAFIMYTVLLYRLGWIGSVIAILFPVCGALRLARFNVQQKSTNYFVGLPITAAGGILATMALFENLLNPAPLILSVAMVALALLMVSNVRYPNFKKVAFPRSAIIIVPLLAFLIYMLFEIHQGMITRVIFIALALYAVYGIGRSLRKKWRSRRDETELDIEESITKS